MHDTIGLYTLRARPTRDLVGLSLSRRPAAQRRLQKQSRQPCSKQVPRVSRSVTPGALAMWALRRRRLLRHRHTSLANRRRGEWPHVRDVMT